MLAQVANGGILPRVAVLQVHGQPVVDFPGLRERILIAANNGCGKRFDFRREHHMRRLAGECADSFIVWIGEFHFLRLQIKINAARGKLIFHRKFRGLICARWLLKMNGPYRAVLTGNQPGRAGG